MDIIISLESIAYVIIVAFFYWLFKTLIYYGFKYNFKFYDLIKARYSDKQKLE